PRRRAAEVGDPRTGRGFGERDRCDVLDDPDRLVLLGSQRPRGSRQDAGPSPAAVVESWLGPPALFEPGVVAFAGVQRVRDRGPVGDSPLLVPSDLGDRAVVVLDDQAG